jgi:hypothetical protein
MSYRDRIQGLLAAYEWGVKEGRRCSQEPPKEPQAESIKFAEVLDELQRARVILKVVERKLRRGLGHER